MHGNYLSTRHSGRGFIHPLGKYTYVTTWPKVSTHTNETVGYKTAEWQTVILESVILEQTSL